MSAESKHIFRVRIRAPIEVVWDEITQPNVVKPAMFQTKLRANLREGGRIEYTSESTGKAELIGEILELDPPRRLVHTFQFTELSDQPTRVCYDLREVGEDVEVTVTHDRFASETTTFNRVAGGWPVILEELKTIAEGGPQQNLTECPGNR